MTTCQFSTPPLTINIHMAPNAPRGAKRRLAFQNFGLTIKVPASVFNNNPQFTRLNFFDIDPLTADLTTLEGSTTPKTSRAPESPMSPKLPVRPKSPAPHNPLSPESPEWEPTTPRSTRSPAPHNPLSPKSPEWEPTTPRAARSPAYSPC